MDTGNRATRCGVSIVVVFIFVVVVGGVVGGGGVVGVGVLFGRRVCVSSDGFTVPA